MRYTKDNVDVGFMFEVTGIIYTILEIKHNTTKLSHYRELDDDQGVSISVGIPVEEIIRRLNVGEYTEYVKENKSRFGFTIK